MTAVGNIGIGIENPQPSTKLVAKAHQPAGIASDIELVGVVSSPDHQRRALRHIVEHDRNRSTGRIGGELLIVVHLLRQLNPDINLVDVPGRIADCRCVRDCLQSDLSDIETLVLYRHQLPGRLRFDQVEQRVFPSNRLVLDRHPLRIQPRIQILLPFLDDVTVGNLQVSLDERRAKRLFDRNLLTGLLGRDVVDRLDSTGRDRRRGVRDVHRRCARGGCWQNDRQQTDECEKKFLHWFFTSLVKLTVRIRPSSSVTTMITELEISELMRPQVTAS